MARHNGKSACKRKKPLIDISMRQTSMLSGFRLENIVKRLNVSLVITLAIGLARLGSLKRLRAKYNTSRVTKGSLKRPFYLIFVRMIRPDMIIIEIITTTNMVLMAAETTPNKAKNMRIKYPRILPAFKNISLKVKYSVLQRVL